MGKKINWHIKGKKEKAQRKIAERRMAKKGIKIAKPIHEKSEPMTICVGTGSLNEPTNCGKFILAKLGVLQPRCPECFEQHLKMLRNFR